MAKYRGKGSTIRYSNAGTAISKDDIVIVENCICVALEDIAATTGEGELAIEGEFELPCVSTSVIAQGENVIYDVSAGNFDDDAATPAAGDVSKGAVATKASGNGVATVWVRLMPGSGTVT